MSKSGKDRDAALAGEHSLEVSVDVAAQQETVWRFLSEGERFAAWIGAFAGQPPLPGTKIEPQVGGEVRVEYPHGHAGVGEILEMEAPRRVLFSWGFSNELHGMPPGSTRMEITLSAIPSGTRVTLKHSGLPSEDLAAGAASGWVHYLSMLAKAAAAAEFGPRIEPLIDKYYAAWLEPDAAKRAKLLAETTSEDVRMRSGFATTNSREALDAHIAGAQQHMPGVSLERTSAAQCLHEYAQWDVAAKASDNIVFAGKAYAKLTAGGVFAELVGFPATGGEAK